VRVINSDYDKWKSGGDSCRWRVAVNRKVSVCQAGWRQCAVVKVVFEASAQTGIGYRGPSEVEARDVGNW
jgi:hypothetical protein